MTKTIILCALLVIQATLVYFELRYFKRGKEKKGLICCGVSLCIMGAILILS
jgi:hypothetical protein